MALVSNTTGCLKVAVYVYYPFIFLSQDDPPYQVTGSMTEVLNILAQTLNFCFEYVVPDDRQFGREDANGSWTGMIGLLTRNEADMTGVVVGLDLDRSKVVDFSDFLYMDQERLIYKRPVVESDMAGFLKPFTFTSWVMVLAALVAMAGVVLLTSQVSPQPVRPSSRRDDEGSREQETVWNTLLDAGLWSVAVSLAHYFNASITRHLSPASTLVPRGLRQQAVVGMWLLLALIISTVYRSNLKAMLIKPRLILPFSNLEELVETRIPCFTFRGTLLHRNIEARGVVLPASRGGGRT
ncbi:Glutamate receptor 2 [Portunus trituberculatus]|uniref:Glutamate receptor 2 n=1 Tax=Portunus trituberculatus TaxID=210409 RepID=A0A5B7DUV4_PORTR|nr:Glutamate receptor 2 [Portunus trituberculatus]